MVEKQMADIPKVIHYCWFGDKTKPSIFYKCFASWKKYCPDYEIKEWNESNFDINVNTFCKEAYENKKYAFVSDVARLEILYNEGGIYVDADVEFIRNIDELLSHRVIVGYEQQAYGYNYIATGLFLAAEKHHPWIKKMLEDYQNRSFYGADSNLISCTFLNTQLTIQEYGLVPDGKSTTLDDDICIYSSEYFCPINYSTQKINIQKNTYAIHHYAGTWLSKKQKIGRIVKRVLGEKAYYLFKIVMDRGRYD